MTFKPRPSRGAAAALPYAEPLACEPTPVGAQTLVPGVAPVSLAEQLAYRLAAPLEPRRAAAQRPCDIGLFDVSARAQTDLVDLARAARPSPPAAKE